MIYPIDLTYFQFKEINNFIYEKIKEYNSKFKECSMSFASLRYMKFQGKKNEQNSVYVYNNPLFNILDNKNNKMLLNKEIKEIYGYDQEQMTISGSEFLKNITIADWGNLFNTSISFTNIELTYPKNLSKIFDNDKDRMKNIILNDQQKDKCSSFIIAKKYYSIETLLADNNKHIYYDKEFDTTNYELIEEKYKKERDNLSTTDFILFLTDKFKEKDKMEENEAEYMATTLVNQAKKVREGDYALFIKNFENINGEPQAEEMEYYIRNDDKWVLDKEVDPKQFIKDDDILCNMNYDCMYNGNEKTEDKCESTEVSKDTIIQQTLKQIIEQFDKNYDISKTELNTIITNKLTYFKELFSFSKTKINSKNFTLR
jgi:hypothetical protein